MPVLVQRYARAPLQQCRRAGSERFRRARLNLALLPQDLR
jgi:hypothetical protein